LAVVVVTAVEVVTEVDVVLDPVEVRAVVGVVEPDWDA
jgi:hypothetical protein